MAILPWQDFARLPDLDAKGQKILLNMVEHPNAPIFHNQSGHHLTPKDQQKLAQFERGEIHQNYHPDGGASRWFGDFIGTCKNQVPFYRQYDWPNLKFDTIPIITRADLSQDIAQFVPDNLTLDRLITYTTSGTTGFALTIPSHPEVAAKYSTFHKKALLYNGIDTNTFNSDVAVMLAGFQQKCFTYVSLAPYLKGKGLVKLNFHPDDWYDSAHRAAYVNELAPDLITGDPLSLSELMKLDITHSPQAILSTSMMLLNQQKAAFEQKFGCRVINIYSMNEAGPIAASIEGSDGLRLLQSQMIVEILDEAGNSVPENQRGEIVITGGFNHYLPLLRYRTGDFARLKQDKEGAWCLFDFEGRPPVSFKTANGNWINNVDITHTLQRFTLPQFTVHQDKNSDITLRVRGIVNKDELRKALKSVLGEGVCITIELNCQFEDKVVQYTSELVESPVRE